MTNPIIPAAVTASIARQAVAAGESIASGAGGIGPASADAAAGTVARGPRPDYERMVGDLITAAQEVLIGTARPDDLDHARRNLLATLHGLYALVHARLCANGSAICEDEHPCAECAGDRADAADRERELRAEAGQP